MRMIDPKSNTNLLYVSQMAFDQMQRIPTVDAEVVVRCRDCKKYHAELGWCDEHSHFIDADREFCHPHESTEWKMFDADDFCSYGEKRGEG